MLEASRPQPRYGHAPSVAEQDAVWDRIQHEARQTAQAEPALSNMLEARVLRHRDLGCALAQRLSTALADDCLAPGCLQAAALAAYVADPSVLDAARHDIVAVFERDPATWRYLQPFLYFKGFRAIQAHRLAHRLWLDGQRDLALFIQMRVSDLFAIDIHPAARIGAGLMIDHAHGVVIGETAVIGNNVTLLHSVTLGGTGKEGVIRHPTIGDDVTIGAGAKVLGSIVIGTGARIAAGSVVLRDVPAHKTVVGVPGRIVENTQKSRIDATLATPERAG